MSDVCQFEWRLWSRDVEIQSRRAVIQPGFLTNQVENVFPIASVKAFSCLGGQETRLHHSPGGLGSDFVSRECWYAFKLFSKETVEDLTTRTNSMMGVWILVWQMRWIKQESAPIHICDCRICMWVFYAFYSEMTPYSQIFLLRRWKKLPFLHLIKL